MVMADDTARQWVNQAQTTEHRTEVMHSLVQDGAVAAQVTSDVLRRPEAAARVAAVGGPRVGQRPQQVPAQQRVELLRRSQLSAALRGTREMAVGYRLAVAHSPGREQCP